MEDELLRKAARYLSAVVRGERVIADPAEKNDRWAAGVRLFAGATLARISPEAQALDEVWGRWAEIVSRVFHRGRFDAQAQVRAHAELHGLRDGVAYLGLANRYAVTLIGARASELPVRIRRAYGEWLWNRADGLGYVNVRCWPPPARPEGRAIGGWLQTVELLMSFGVCRREMQRAIDWLWAQRNGELWDFGPRATALRFSADWRRSGQRGQDHSLAALLPSARLGRR